MGREVVIVGAGVVGTSVARELVTRGVGVTVLDRDHGTPRGSTAHAPGFLGLYNDVAVLTELARESVSIYDSSGRGLLRSGGLELATSDAGVCEVERRVEAARSAGLRAELVLASDIPDTVAAFVDVAQVRAVGHFLDDASADVALLAPALRAEAAAGGARFLEDQEAVGVESAGAKTVVVTATGSRFPADTVVLAGGVWGPRLASMTGLDLPLVPVAHPYVYDGPGAAGKPGPFVRWPDRHVYSRMHGARLGIGSYDHRPVDVGQDGLADGAGLSWSEDFDPVIDSAQSLLRPEVRFTPQSRVNGVFAMTPDNLPFVGRHPAMEDVWIAQALWVTHAAGAARRLVAAVLDDGELPDELGPARFEGMDPAGLRDRALRLYRDIYANDA